MKLKPIALIKASELRPGDEFTWKKKRNPRTVKTVDILPPMAGQPFSIYEKILVVQPNCKQIVFYSNSLVNLISRKYDEAP